jgi:hypothetical protein
LSINRVHNLVLLQYLVIISQPVVSSRDLSARVLSSINFTITVAFISWLNYGEDQKKRMRVQSAKLQIDHDMLFFVSCMASFPVRGA